MGVGCALPEGVCNPAQRFGACGVIAAGGRGIVGRTMRAGAAREESLMNSEDDSAGGAIEVYYNAVCPVCDAGVNENRRAMEKRGAGGKARWIDMASAPQALAGEGIELDDVRRHIRVRDAKGTLHKGADACAVMWEATPGRRWLGRFTRLALVLPVARFVYFRFADGLYWWNKRKGRW